MYGHLTEMYPKRHTDVQQMLHGCTNIPNNIWTDAHMYGETYI